MTLSWERLGLFEGRVEVGSDEVYLFAVWYDVLDVLDGMGIQRNRSGTVDTRSGVICSTLDTYPSHKAPP